VKHGVGDRSSVQGLLAVDEALQRVLGAIPGALPAETIPTDEGLGRILAGPVIARTDLPPWDNSAMDGYAVRSADTHGATEDRPVRLDVVGEVRAGGGASGPLPPGCVVRIATGAPIPPGADAVVPVEETTPVDPAGRPGARGRDASGPLPAACLVHVDVPSGGSIRRRGSDLVSGMELLAAGSELTPAGVALAAGAGVPLVFVHRQPVVGVLATGDEVRRAGEDLGAAGIPDANGPGVRALVRAAGGVAVDLGIATDRLDDVVARLRDAIPLVDCVIVSGGVSVGPFDVVKPAFEMLGEVDLWRVAVQPGKPFAFGTAARPGMPPALLFGLPGNPVSSFVTFELFVRPALRRLAGRTVLMRPRDRAVLLEPVSKSAGRRAFLRVVAERIDGDVARDAAGRVQVRLAGSQGSHVLSALAAADALAVVPEADDSLPAGSPVELWWLDPA